MKVKIKAKLEFTLEEAQKLVELARLCHDPLYGENKELVDRAQDGINRVYDLYNQVGAFNGH